MNERVPLQQALPLIRQRLHMNYQEIAYYCHVTDATIGNWLKGGNVYKIVSKIKLKELAHRAQLTITDVK